jgi:hypothetical protein
MDPQSFSKLDPDPHSLKKLDPDSHEVNADPIDRSHKFKKSLLNKTNILDFE